MSSLLHTGDFTVQVDDVVDASAHEPSGSSSRSHSPIRTAQTGQAGCVINICKLTDGHSHSYKTEGV